MEGFRVIFSTLRDRKHKETTVHEWLISKAKALEIDGITVINALEGYGRDKTIHSVGFFELADQPIEIIIVAEEKKCDKLFAKIREEGLSIFYAKYKAEFGFTA